MLSTQNIWWCIQNCKGYTIADEAKQEFSAIIEYIEKLEAAQLSRSACSEVAMDDYEFYETKVARSI